MKGRIGFAAALAIVAGAALLLRAPDLGNRPIHADEAVHAFKLWDIRSTGDYAYDPDEFHGPTLYYAALPVLAAKGRTDFGDVTESDCRLAVAILGVLLIPALALMSDGLGRKGAVAAAALLALSPAFVFYSRYFIQETLLVAFTLAAMGCAWRYSRSPRLMWALSGGLSVGLMVATKETAALSLAAWGFAAAIIRYRPATTEPPRFMWKHAAGAGLAALIVAALFLTGMGRHLDAIPDYFRSYAPWLHRAHGTDLHRHPWTYYIGLLAWHRSGSGPIWTEAAILAPALLGAIVSFARPYEARTALGRRLVVWSIALLVAYSLVPYKTPWCVLSPLLGLALVAGIGASWLADRARPKALRSVAPVLAAAAVGQLGWQAYRTSFVYHSDPRNPYVYAQTIHDAEDIRARAEALAPVHPDGRQMVVKVFWSDPYYWPIPWYLRGFTNVGYWQNVPDDADAPLIFASPEFDEELTRRLDATHLMNGYVGLRPSVVAMVWVRMDLWTRYIERKQSTKTTQ